MNTPIWDFVNTYAHADFVRLHMPGHKGNGPIGCERFDITEVQGADALYEASGIIAESEANAASLFSAARTLYSTEGSSQCIRAMVYLAAVCCKGETSSRPVIVAARNAHHAFLHACALSDVDIEWLYPDSCALTLMNCPVTPAYLDEVLCALRGPCCGVYLTSPDYLGQCQDIAALARVCRRHYVPLLVDNAHGAYLHFLPQPAHPLDLGADMCCDSAHKTLPALTGAAYLHISEHAPEGFAQRAKSAMALFGSTSPSYLILSSLDLCNPYLEKTIRGELAAAKPAIECLRSTLRRDGWSIPEGDLLHLSVIAGESRMYQDSGESGCLNACIAGEYAVRSGPGQTADDMDVLGRCLRQAGIEPEYVGKDAVMMLLSPRTAGSDAEKIIDAMRKAANSRRASGGPMAYSSECVQCPVLRERPEKVLSVRAAMFSDCEWVPTGRAVGRIAAAPCAFCPPAVSPVMPGERISGSAAAICRYYGYSKICVTREK